MMFGHAPGSSATNVADASAQEVLPPVTPQPLNPTGRDIDLTVPVVSGGALLGDIAVRIRADGEIEVPSARFLELLALALRLEALEKSQPLLEGRMSIGLNTLEPVGITLRYDPQTIELVLDIPLDQQKVRTLSIAPYAVERFGAYEQPAAFSAFLTVRGAINHVERGPDPGLDSPVLVFDGATRFREIVFETQGIYQPGGPGPAFQRQGSRFVYDDLADLMRWTAGDLRTVARGFQSAPDIAGISLFRSYGDLQPQTITRPSGRQSFRLERPSTVEIWINDQLVRRSRLEPGTYDLRDFPYTQGVDNARVLVRDDAGRTETLNFTLFTDQYQLAAGLSEFGIYAGVKAPLGLSGPVYSSEPAFSGFYRRGITDELTLGANVQADRRSRMAGVESILAMPFGAFAANLAVSDTRGRGMGYAAVVTFESLIEHANTTSDAINLSAETWSKDFAPVGGFFSENPHMYRLGANYSHAFGENVYAGVDLLYAKGRGSSPDVKTVRGTLGWRLLPKVHFDVTAIYEAGTPIRERGLTLQASLTLQLGGNSSAMATYDSGFRTARLSYQMQHGQDVGSFNLAGALERSPQGVGISGTANYIASEGELGLDHFTEFGGDAGAPGDSHTSLRFATSVAIADGAVSIGRPISDAFAIVSRLDNVSNARVTIDPSPYGYIARTTLLGTATVPNLISYNDRTITLDAPDADADVDLGPGAYRVHPPYRAGYRLEAGTEYPVTLIGRFLDEDGAPLALVAGIAIEVAAPSREPLAVFTNGAGRFGLAGVKPGRWRIEFHTDPATVYELDVPVDATLVLQMGDVVPWSAGTAP